MPHLFSPDGDKAIARILAQRPLLALDFDGTLAPIVPQPENARAPLAISRILKKLCNRLPVAIVSGRAKADVIDRLGFVPHYLIGNHGAEGLPDVHPDLAHDQVAQWKAALEQFAQEFSAAGVRLEDKGYSLSLHYRLARERDDALALIEKIASSLSPAPRLIGGKCVLNLLPPDAPDKYRAICHLLILSGCDSVIFAGDDLTDDVVFEKAPQDWLTVRVEPAAGHRARFHLSHQNEMFLFLQRLLSGLESLQRPDVRKLFAGP